MITRRKTRQIQVGGVTVGGGAPITVQSMTKTDTRDVQATLLEIWSLEAAGCDIVRCAVPVREAAEKLGEIKRQIRIPLVADIHFNYKLALIALEQGVDGLRLNPGNIGGKAFVQEGVNVAKEKRIPVRIGGNAGPLAKERLARGNGPSAAGLAEPARPTEEVRVGIDILKSLGLRKGGLTFVSCPSCGRADVDLVKLAKEVEDEFKGLNEEIHIAVMGCEVNGPGEARAADIGVAGGRGIGLIFKNGDVIRKVPEKEIVQAMREEVDKFIAERKAAKTAAVEAE